MMLEVVAPRAESERTQSKVSTCPIIYSEGRLEPTYLGLCPGVETFFRQEAQAVLVEQDYFVWRLEEGRWQATEHLRAAVDGTLPLVDAELARHAIYRTMRYLYNHITDIGEDIYASHSESVALTCTFLSCMSVVCKVSAFANIA